MSTAQPALSKRDLKVPFFKQLEAGQLCHGTPIGFKGCLTGEAFTFNLATGRTVAIFTPQIDDRIALQLSYKTGRGMTLSSFSFNRWGDQVTYADVKLRPGKPFHFSIQPQENGYMVSLNGSTIGEYRYVVPLDKITHVYVQGDISLKRLEFEGDYYMTPFKHMFTSFTEGSKLHICGTPLPTAETVTIDLAENGDVPLHLELDFTHQFIKKNQAKRGEWREADTIKAFPFAAERPFDIVVAVEDEYLEVFVDGRRFTRFTHLLDSEAAMCIKVRGDVNLQNVHLAD